MEFRNLQEIDAALVGILPALTKQYDCLACCSEEAAVVAQLLALHLRLPLVRLDAAAGSHHVSPSARLLLVELVVNDHGDASHLKAMGQQLCPSGEVCLLAIYAKDEAKVGVDLIAERVSQAPYFEWNFLQREGLDRVCFDIDGVLCEDPTYEQNDDGPLYLEFLSTARPLHLPQAPIGWLVTSRLEKYRELTEQWMAEHGIRFSELHMINLPNKEARKAAKCHGSFKAEVYASVDAELFIESNPHQAWEIAETSGKPVFCVDTMQMVDLGGPAPSTDTPASEEDPLRKRARRAMARLARRFK